MKNLNPIFATLLLITILFSCSKNEDIQPMEEMTSVELLQSKTWEVYDHTRNGLMYWQAEDNFGGLAVSFNLIEAQNGDTIWSFKDNTGQVYSECSGSFQSIDDSNVLITFNSAECEMGSEAFVLVLTQTLDELIMNGTIEGNSWIFRLR